MATPNFSWAIRGTVVHGHGRGGTQLGFPTANVGLDLATTEMLLPLQNWVYFGWGCVEAAATAASANPVGVEAGQVFPLVMSVGFNPHFKDKALTVEAYFMHKFAADFYGETVRIISCGPVREQAAFTTLEALIEIIRGDCAYAQDRLGGSKSTHDYLRFRSHPFLTQAGSSDDPHRNKLPVFITNLAAGSSL